MTATSNVIYLLDYLETEKPTNSINSEQNINFDIASDINSSITISESDSKKSNTRSDAMDWQEKYIDSLDKNVRDIKTEISAVKSELKSDFDNKINQFMAELRDRDNQRHAEILTMQTRIDENVRGLRSEILTTNRWVMGLVVTAGLAFLGIAISLSIGMFNVVDIIRTLVVK